MMSIDLVKNPKVPSFKNLKLMPKELCYIRLPSLMNLSDEISFFIQESSVHSSEVILSIPSEDFCDDDLREKFLSIGIKGFAIRVSHEVEKWLKHQGFGQFNSGDRDIIDMFHRYRSILNTEKELVVEFQVGEDLRVLGPTITGIYEFGAKWIVLNDEGSPTSKRCFEYREVFEYLRIRSCNKLNVYFPFWNNYFREWDIKTQNTFSGLKDVHIDISNRCTHSCVFCGLYGPEAIEDMKRRGGGDISAEMKKYMKMEIESERCHSIIRSLPWSVGQIQFGGMGDPLMHDDAIDFISAARERGFKIEILSNMEYLDEEDISRLHKLGGDKIFDLHFIANVSAGDADLYVKTRPKQTEKNFHKIVHNLSSLTKLRNESSNSGVYFTIMCVVNKINYKFLKEVSELAVKVGASRVWFKPMEIHIESHAPYIPVKESMRELSTSLRDAINYAEDNGVLVFQKDYCEEIIRRYSGDTINV
jgi:wyosine [tRNA(Phe)-imidazoG37] synthetase (radical SAM superfamily)